MARNYPVGKAQQIVLDALNLKAGDFSEAKRIFESLGITVGSKRQARSSVPVVTVKDRFGGGFSAAGDGFEYRKYDDVDLSAVQQWVEE